MCLFIFSCTGGGGGGDTTTPSSGGNNGGENPSGGGSNGEASAPQPALNQRAMNAWVVELDDQGAETSSYPLLYNYQEFDLSADSVKIKIECSECDTVAHAKTDVDLGVEYYPRINSTFNMPENLDNDSFIPTFFMGSDEKNYITINGYSADGSIVNILYLKVSNFSDSNSRVEPPEKVTCNQAMFDNHSSLARNSNYMKGECFDGSDSYNASGFLDKDESLFHIVRFDADPDNPGKELIKHTIVDLKNFEMSIANIDDYYNLLNSGSKPPLKKFEFIVDNNLDLGGGVLKSYPIPQITRIGGSLFIASAVGVNKQLNIYRFDDMTTSWISTNPGDAIVNIKKLKFSVRVDIGSKTNVLYFTKTELDSSVSFNEYSFNEAGPISSQAYTFTTPISLYDFSVDFNGDAGITKFIFIDDQGVNKPVYLASYNESFNLTNFNISSCKNGNDTINFSDFDAATAFYHPRIKVAPDGRSWFKVDIRELNTTNLSTIYNSSNIPLSIICKERILLNNESFEANGFADTFEFQFDIGVSNIELSRSLDGDLLVSSVIEDTEIMGFVYTDYIFSLVGGFRFNKGLFGKPLDISVISSGYNFPFTFPTGSLLSNLGLESRDHVADITLYDGGKYNIVALSNPYNKEFNELKSVCFSYSNKNLSDFNTFLDRYLGINDQDQNNYDHDGDGVDDFMEYYLGLNPSMADSDGDGTPDATEADNFCQ